MLLLYLAQISFISFRRASRISGEKEPKAGEEETEDEEEGEEEDEETFLLVWLIGGLVFSSLRCLLET